jgi:hypothetical protein
LQDIHSALVEVVAAGDDDHEASFGYDPDVLTAHTPGQSHDPQGEVRWWWVEAPPKVAITLSTIGWDVGLGQLTDPFLGDDAPLLVQEAVMWRSSGLQPWKYSSTSGAPSRTTRRE